MSFFPTPRRFFTKQITKRISKRNWTELKPMQSFPPGRHYPTQIGKCNVVLGVFSETNPRTFGQTPITLIDSIPWLQIQKFASNFETLSICSEPVASQFVVCEPFIEVPKRHSSQLGWYSLNPRNRPHYQNYIDSLFVISMLPLGKLTVVI